MNRLQERYENEVVKSLMEKFNYSSKMQAPKIEKIVLNIGVGDAVSNSKLLDDAVNELTLITVKNQLSLELKINCWFQIKRRSSNRL